jgi:hypothetical protein
VAGLNLRLRHSPGMMRREVSPDTSKSISDRECGAGDLSCFHSLPPEKHAVFQCGWAEKILTMLAKKIIQAGASGVTNTLAFIILARIAWENGSLAEIATRSPRFRISPIRVS